jgi:hypothetical protein
MEAPAGHGPKRGRGIPEEQRRGTGARAARRRGGRITENGITQAVKGFCKSQFLFEVATKGKTINRAFYALCEHI